MDKVQRRTIDSNVDIEGDLHPVLKRVLAGRNIKSVNELDYSLSRLLPYHSLKGIDQSAILLADLIENDNKLLIIADYDVDGATSCALALRVLHIMGAKHVDYMVPDRFKHGYGLSLDVAQLALSEQPDVVMTVDNGISSVDGIALLRTENINVLVTDHHLPGKELPDASVIVNPNLPDDSFPSKCIAGVGVMFYVLASLRSELKQRGWFEKQGLKEPNLANYLDLVALGTVADVVPLDYNNRILVSHGLELIRSGRCSAGISALLKIANRQQQNINASDLGFSVGPRLNAAGRLTDMRLGIECLISEDEQQAYAIAVELDSLNRERREIQNEMQEQALFDLDELNIVQEGNIPFGVCLFNEDWHQGVIGILASRIKEKLNRPVVVFARDDGEMLKGSARSIDGLHIKDLLDHIATEHPGLIAKYGGHAMAAGLSLAHEHYETFCKLYNEAARDYFDANVLSDAIVTDGELADSDMSLSLAGILRDAGPWGQRFPEPLFDGVFTVKKCKVLAEKHLKLGLVPAEKTQIIDAIAFNQAEASIAEGVQVHAVYRVDINEFRGKRSLQFVVEVLEQLP